MALYETYKLQLPFSVFISYLYTGCASEECLALYKNKFYATLFSFFMQVRSKL